jgi:23S rRNA (uracil1939-C5)-methyltransferase
MYYKSQAVFEIHWRKVNMAYNEQDRSIHCPVSKDCGGCTYTSVAYDKELEKKQKFVDQLFEGICKCEPINGMYRPAYYRNKVHAVVGLDREKNIITGNYKEGSHRIVPVEACMIEDQKADEIIATLKTLFKSFKYEPYDEDKKTGFVRHILIRRGFSTKEVMVVLVTSIINFPSKNHFVKALLEKHPEITTIVQNVNGMSTSMVLGNRNNTIYGKGYIEDVLCGCRFRISPQSFYQINPSQTEKLYKAAIKMADLKKTDTVIDAYCGIGTIGITAAKHAGKVIGVELNSQAVNDAQINAKLNNISNISFINDDAGEFLVDYAKNNKADVVIMDPPRSGSTEDFINSLIKIKPEKIVYISCNPETQVRDLRPLLKAGYKLKECRPFDLFPHTEHVETVCLLLKK